MTAADALTVVASTLVSVGGAGAIMFGLSTWLGKVWANRILESDRAKYAAELEHVRAEYRHEIGQKLHLLRDRIERGQFVHRIQFETEFKAYQKLWIAVTVAQLAALGLRPVVDNTGGLTPEELKKSRLEALDAAFWSFRRCYRDNRPFLAKEVFDAATKLSDAIYIEGIDYQVSDSPRSQEYWRKAQENASKINAHADVICETIRQRIGMIGYCADPNTDGS